MEDKECSSQDGRNYSDIDDELEHLGNLEGQDKLHLENLPNVLDCLKNGMLFIRISKRIKLINNMPSSRT